MKVRNLTLRPASTVIVPEPELVKVPVSELLNVPDTAPGAAPPVHVVAVQLPVVPVQVALAAWALPPEEMAITAKSALVREERFLEWIFFIIEPLEV